LKLPRDVSIAGQEKLTARYKASCVDGDATVVNTGNMWYHWRPDAPGCAPAAEDLALARATVSISAVNTSGKFPEYQKVWEDGVLKVVAIFGKNEEGATGDDDAGIAAHEEFLGAVEEKLWSYGLAKIAVGTKDTTFRATLPDGRSVEVVVLLVDNVRTEGAAFDARYATVSKRADLIAYNGHAGLGANVRALAKKGKWAAGQYLIFFLNGCDTYAYLDGALEEAHAAVNPGDPAGTRHLDLVVNAMPSWFHSDAPNTIALIEALMRLDLPRTYQTLFQSIDPAQVVLVTGEEDNVYFPGWPGTFHERTSVGEGETLAFHFDAEPGSYRVVLAHDPTEPGGDADLYVGVGFPPTAFSWSCRPWREGSDEECKVSVAIPTRIYMNVEGYAEGDSAFLLAIHREGGGGAVWPGFDASFAIKRAVEKRWQTPALAAGSYVFDLQGAGDADLYVRIGEAATTSRWDCRPYRTSSRETCEVSAPAGAAVHAMVRGYAPSSSVRLVAYRL
jgi:hypothetical protein